MIRVTVYEEGDVIGIPIHDDEGRLVDFDHYICKLGKLVQVPWYEASEYQKNPRSTPPADEELKPQERIEIDLPEGYRTIGGGALISYRGFVCQVLAQVGRKLTVKVLYPERRDSSPQG